MIKVSIVMGSKSDLEVMQECIKQLKYFDIHYEVRILSAHRTPVETHDYADCLISKGVKVVIAAAGGAAHLAGVIAGSTTLPVIGVPIESKSLKGMDSLLSIVQMPKGIPVATLAIGKAGAINAAILAAQILAISDRELAYRLIEFKKEMAEKVMKDSFVESYEG
ncbi:MAG: 5-(carboxyamino)imidazole ribonucleotide mutase [Anaerorhabdus sp.]